MNSQVSGRRLVDASHDSVASFHPDLASLLAARPTSPPVDMNPVLITT